IVITCCGVSMVVVHYTYRYVAICLNIRTAVSDVKGCGLSTHNRPQWGRGVVYSNSTDNSIAPKPGYNAPSHTYWRGQHHGVTSCFLSARPARTPLAFCH